MHYRNGREAEAAIMHRPLKFRAWDKKYKEMVDCMKWSGPFDEGWPFNDDQYEFEQFTGLTDKNGKEIYEGDIVRAIKEGYTDINGEFHSGKELWTYIVEIDPACVVLKHWKSEIKYPVLTTQYTDQMMVIGNIHQSPDLLKKLIPSPSCSS